jgi:hypothetical protein
MLNNIPISDQQMKGGISLTQAGKMKVAARLGIGPREVEMYLNVITQQLRDRDETDTEASLSEQYYNAVNVMDEDEEAGHADRPFDRSEGRYSYEPDALGSITIRDSLTGHTAFIQGAAASKLMAQLKMPIDHDRILAPLVETLDDTVDPPVDDFWDEIHANSGSYNFQWKLANQHGTGTVQFQANNKMKLTLIDVRDENGDEINADDAMQRELIHQARKFIGQE